MNQKDVVKERDHIDEHKNRDRKRPKKRESNQWQIYVSSVHE